ncbi:metalloregulator ArsR/SmtB family transcription factor [Nitrosomonas sp. Nm166]|uniref:helix-turn-helix transcriptional regulator n=1 Tax=Nitrosomonas sp. Nm166 TaxID=1881054 RepID=UPI0008ED9910|nr:ArsR family transcriptional regulator [Nitrosomonas sp. Nm166]SFE54665.1 Predicted transcriptional regulator, ArsR family [Nitrosomonas sp. Nm166]
MSALSFLGQSQQLLVTALLRHRKGLTVDELSRLLSISRNAVNQHLSSLGNNGFIQSSMLESTGGRPSKIYALSPRGLELFQRRYSFIAKLLLAWVGKNLGEEDLKVCLQTLGEQMAGEFENRMIKQLSPIDKLREVTAIMCELGYDASMQQISAHRAEITAHNCIFYKLAEEYQGFCALDLSFLASLLKTDIEHKECIVKKGDRCCFVIADSVNPIRETALLHDHEP